MVRRRQLVNVLVFLGLAGLAVWWLAQNWSRTPAGGAAVAGRQGAGLVAAAGADATVLPPGPAATAASTHAAGGGTAGATGGSSAATKVAAKRPVNSSSSSSGKASAAAAALRAASTSGTAQSAADYFAEARMQRAQADSRELDQLEAMADDPATSAAVRAEAQQQILQLDTMQREQTAAEMVLGAKGFSQALVLLSSGGAVVVVEAPHFDAAQAASVAQAVSSAASLNPDQVQIVARR